MQLYCTNMPDPVKPDRRAARRAETEARLIAAASDLFVQRGYAATTLADVAEQAGLAPRTVYLRFSTKAELLRRCIGAAIVGDTAPVPLAERDWLAATMTAPTL
jgi:AcrR family transcriptional regulator